MTLSIFITAAIHQIVIIQLVLVTGHLFRNLYLGHSHVFLNRRHSSTFYNETSEAMYIAFAEELRRHFSEGILLAVNLTYQKITWVGVPQWHFPPS